MANAPARLRENATNSEKEFCAKGLHDFVAPGEFRYSQDGLYLEWSRWLAPERPADIPEHLWKHVRDELLRLFRDRLVGARIAAGAPRLFWMREAS